MFGNFRLKKKKFFEINTTATSLFSLQIIKTTLVFDKTALSFLLSLFMLPEKQPKNKEPYQVPPRLKIKP